MTPEHHEERLRVWAIRTGRPVLSIDYGKAPECMRPLFFRYDCFHHAVPQILTHLRLTKLLTRTEYLSSLAAK